MSLDINELYNYALFLFLQYLVYCSVGFGVGNHIFTTRNVSERYGIKIAEFLLDIIIDRGDILIFDMEDAVELVYHH